MTQKYILIGAKPPKNKLANLGGQLTASIGLVDYMESVGFDIEVIDTSQSSFPVPLFKERLIKGLNRTKQLFNLLKTEKIDGVIIFSSSGFSFYERIFQSLICRFFKVADIFFVRSGHFMTTTSSSTFKRLIAKVLLKIPRRIGVQGSAWIPFYQSLGVNREKCILIRNWLQCGFPVAEKARSYNKTRAISFVFVGWLVKEKGIVQLLNAFTSLQEKYNVKLHLVGGGVLEKFCFDFQKNNCLEDKLYLHGWCEKGKVIELVNKCDIFVLPSEAEGFPNALLEAVALGLPTICTNVGGVSDTLLNNSNGFLLESNESDLIYEAMQKYLENPSLILDHSKAALKIYQINHNRVQNCGVLLDQFRHE